jgi:hypothetical protein
MPDVHSLNSTGTTMHRAKPLKVLVGAESAIIDEMTLAYMRRELGGSGIPVSALPGCAHHLFFDEPFAFVGVVAARLRFPTRSYARRCHWIPRMFT